MFWLFYGNEVVANQLICSSVTSFYRRHFTMSRDSNVDYVRDVILFTIL